LVISFFFKFFILFNACYLLQLEDIKDKARQVSELPDRDFNNLVLQARTFSLAPTGITLFTFHILKSIEPHKELL